MSPLPRVSGEPKLYNDVNKVWTKHTNDYCTIRRDIIPIYDKYVLIPPSIRVSGLYSFLYLSRLAWDANRPTLLACPCLSGISQCTTHTAMEGDALACSTFFLQECCKFHSTHNRRQHRSSVVGSDFQFPCRT